MSGATVTATEAAKAGLGSASKCATTVTTTDSGSSLDIAIHPLVVISIADQHTRTVQQYPLLSRVFGLLYGRQDGRTVTVHETVEIAYTVANNDAIVIGEKALEVDVRLFSESYPTYECLGWYSTGSAILPQDLDLHRLMSKYNERPLYLMLDPSAGQPLAQGELPVHVYEEVVHINQGVTSMEFVRAKFRIDADEAERIVSYHCSTLVQTAEGDTQIASHYTMLAKAVGSLRDRIAAVRAFLRDHQAGRVLADQSILRDIRGLCQRLPLIDVAVPSGAAFVERANAEENETLLVTLLATLTQANAVYADLGEDLAVIHAHQTRKSTSTAAAFGDPFGHAGAFDRFAFM